MLKRLRFLFEAASDVPEGQGTAAPVVPAEQALTPKEATTDLLIKRLPHDQAKALRAIQKEKQARADAAKTAAPTPEVKAEVGKTEPVKEAEKAPEAEVIRFGEEEPSKPAAEAEPEVVELTAEELGKLDEKARKRITEASKEAAKVRKRAQEAEAKLTEAQTKLAEMEKASEQATDLQTRGVAMAGNVFHAFKDGHDVAAWGTNAQEAVLLLNNHERAVKAGRANADDPVIHLLPNGEEVELTSAHRASFEQRVKDAQTWFTHDGEITKNRETAKKLAEKHAKTAGYEAARAKYLKDPALPTRLEELVAKAALYDTLESRKAVISFTDTAGAARNAPSSPAGGTPEKPAKTPPSETPAAQPRLVKSDDAHSDLAARKSALMERAKTTSDAALRQKLLKEAIMLGPVKLKRS